MKKILWVLLFVTTVLFSGFVLADVDVTMNIETTGDVNSENYISTNGTVYLYVNGVDWTNVPQYITEREPKWSNNGLNLGGIEALVDKINRYRNGEEVELTDKEYNILLSLLGITDAEISDFYNLQISPILESHYNQILSNLYEIEATYRTFEKLYPDIYCESRQEVMKEHGLKSVKCGLHSKQCYNGRFYPHEGGLDYCIHTDEGHSEDGMEIHLKDLKVYDSDAESISPIEITLYNQGEKTMKPLVKVYIKKLDVVLGSFEQELDEVEGTKTYIIAWDNSGMKPGEYDLKVIVDLDKKEIIKYATFEILPPGTLQKDGEIVSVELVNKPLVNYETKIETMIKNTGDKPTAFKVRGDIYKDGEKAEHIETPYQLLEAGETKPFYLTYKIPDLGEYEVKVKSNHNMEDAIIFEAIPSTATGRFLTSPGIGVGSIFLLVFALYGLRYAYHRKKGYTKGKIEVVVPQNYRKIISKKKKTRRAKK